LADRVRRPWPSLLLVGPTGSGKTPLGRELERRGLAGRRCIHFDFGANLRAIAAAPDGSSGLAAEQVAAIRTSLATGALFEDGDMPMIVRILDAFVAGHGLTPHSLLVLNGLPRHRRQAEGLAGVVGVERVVSLEADAAVIMDRMRLDPGGDRATRIDDERAEVERRLEAFRDRTRPLVGFYRDRSVPISVIPVRADMSAGEMYEILAREKRAE
jgi:adenylate kinase